MRERNTGRAYHKEKMVYTSNEVKVSASSIHARRRAAGSWGTALKSHRGTANGGLIRSFLQ